MSTSAVAIHRNPFPGLRPFREDEEYLFFGRENQVDAMVDKLAATRFLAVVGTSGSGKSSLVNCGLRPALHGGLMSSAGTSWRIAQFRPGSDSMQAMARALAEDGVLFRDYQAGGLTLAEIVDTTLRMSKLGLIDIYEQAQLDKDANLLVVVDQFEELFRYRQLGAGQQENAYGVTEEAAAFVNLLLEARDQTTYPIYIVLTMRSDFLGDCAQFSGLAEAINAGQYLVPRMTRDERRAAISGPVGVEGAEISPVLLTRLVNDVGDNPDQLSILQHALNRTWARWRSEGRADGVLDLTQYEAIGTMAHALDQHAEKAYAELATERQRQICEKLFKALTDKATDPRGVRRPTSLGTLCALADATPAEVTEVIDVFRKPSRSFLMPPAEDTLQAETVIDISHESLMRVWERLKIWADQEAESAQIYCRLAQTSVLHAEGEAGLWQVPDLQVALKWQEQNQPNEVWAQRYHSEFTSAMEFLKKSGAARLRRRLTRSGLTLFVFAVLAGLLVWALVAKRDAQKQASIALAVGAKNLLSTKPAEGLIAAIVSGGDARQFSSDDIPPEVRSSFIEALQILREGGVERNAWFAHDGEIVTSVAMSDDGQTIVTGGWDKKVRIWDGHGNPMGDPFEGHAGRVRSVGLTPDGQTIVSAGFDGVRIWDRRGGAPAQLAAEGMFSSVALSSDGQTVLSYDNSGVRLTERSGRLIKAWVVGEPVPLPTIALSRDGQTIVIGGADGRVRLWNRLGELIVKTIEKHDADVLCVAISANGQTIVSGSIDGTVRLWDAQGRPLTEKPLRGHDGRVNSVAVSAEGQTIVSGGADGTVRLWDRQGKPIGRPLNGHDGNVNSVAVTADGKTIASTGEGGVVRLWERRTPSEPSRGNVGPVVAARFSGDGQTIVTAGSDGRILQWDRDGAPVRNDLNGSYDAQVTDAATVTAAIAPDGKLLVIGRADGKLLLRNQQGAIRDQPFGGDHTAPVTSIAVSGDGKMIVSGDFSGTVRLWDKEGRPIGQPSRGHDGRVVSVAVSFDGQTIVSGGSDGKVLRWNLQGSPVWPPLGASFSSGKGEAVAVSPDGQTIASGSESGMMRLWNGQGAPIRAFKGHDENVSCLAFSPDGETIVSGADDGTVRLWDRNGKPIGHPFKGNDGITSVAFSADGKTFVSGDSAGGVSLRQIGLETFLREACEWLQYHRQLTSPETTIEKRAAEVAKSVWKT
jgi:WD40 repeat protein